MTRPPAPTGSFSAPGAPVAGVQAHLLWDDVDDAQMRRQLDLARESGAGLVRVDVGWASLQLSARDAWEPDYLGRLDAVVTEAGARGLTLLLTLMNTPCWASTAPSSLRQGCAGRWWERGVTGYAPLDPADYARALAFLVARYGHRVAAWEIWNEPNHERFWRAPDPARAYAELARSAYPAAKAACPGVTVVAGSLSQSDHAFTQALYDHGIAGHLDAFAVHPYSDDVSPLDPRNSVDARYSFVRGVVAVREVMLANDDPRPLWLTESGWSTATVRTPDPWRNGVSEADQAEFLGQQYAQVRTWPWVHVNVWFNLLDTGDDRTDLYSSCGLRRVDGSPKPAWHAFRAAATAPAA